MSRDSSAVEYDCTPWAGETRRILRSVLTEREIPHAWEGTVVVVPGDFEDVVDGIVDEVASTARASLGTARATVGYDVSAWSALSQNRLVDLLVESTIPHEWDSEGDLVVHEEDAGATEELIAELGDPDGGDELDGLELHDRLGKLFVAVDRLVNDPLDKTGAKRLAKTYEEIENAAVPFGVDAELWLALHRGCAGLLETIEGVRSAAPGARSFEDVGGVDHAAVAAPGGEEDEAVLEEGAAAMAEESEESVQGRARALRDLLRRFV